MSDSRTVGGLDRLPWLADEPKRAPERRSKRDLAVGAAASIVLVAGVSFWLGMRSQPAEAPQPGPAVQPYTPVPVEQPAPAPQQEVRVAPQPQVAPVRTPEIRQLPVPQVRIAAPPRASADTQPAKQAASESSASSEQPKTAEQASPASMSTAAAKPAAPAQLRPWPPRVVQGAYGRLVQIGAYGSRIQAKRGWVAMVRAYPAVAHLPAVVVESRNSHGRLFYRFQIGTTSQAHSEVLCQRMEGIQLSCAVIGLPWKSKVER